MDKAYSRINWANQPSNTTALGATNLNKMDIAMNTMDDRVIALDVAKAPLDTVNTMVKSVVLDNATGIITVTQQNGTVSTYDTKLEKLAVNFSYDAVNQRLVITLDDGTEQYVDLTSLITEYEFENSPTVGITVVGGKVKAEVPDGGITDAKMQPSYLADLTVQAQTATAQASKSQRYAVGGVEEGDTIDNAKYYKEQAEIARDEAEAIVGFNPATKLDVSNQSTSTSGQALISNGDGTSDFKDALAEEIVYGASNVKAALDNHASELADNAISPEKFIGTDAEKIQQAIDYVVDNLSKYSNLIDTMDYTIPTAIKFTKMYDITGSTLIINRPQDYANHNRNQLYLIGTGGGITKNDAGLMFTAPTDKEATGDINVSNMRFQGVAGTGMVIWNGDKLIRLKCSNNNYLNVDTIISAPNIYVQCVYFINEHITGGDGWKFSGKRYLDFAIDHCLIEDCEHFICNTEALNVSMCCNLRITDSLIENLRGQAIKLGGAYELTIENNYFEQCNIYNQLPVETPYVDLVSLNTNYAHFGLTISGNSFYLTPSQLTAQMPCISISHPQSATFYGNGGCFSSCNCCAGSVLYDLSAFTALQYMTGIADYGTIINPKQYIPLGNPYTVLLADGFTQKTFGIATYYTKTFVNISVPASSDYTLTITPTSFTLTQFSIVNISQRSTNFVIKNIVVNHTANTITIVFANTHTAELFLNPNIVVTNFGM